MIRHILRTARKEYVCTKCQTPIVPGDRYTEMIVMQGDVIFRGKARECIQCQPTPCEWCARKVERSTDGV
jgi:hypothetical protein